MGIGKLNVWATETDNPCKINDRMIYVSVFTCEGSYLVYAGRPYYLLAGQHGHLEVDLPPGIYVVRASSLYCTNGYTDAAVVRVGCDETVCVTLMLPSLRRCAGLLRAALRLPMAREMLPPELITQAQEVLNRVVERLPSPVRGFELDHLEETEKFILARPEPKQEKKESSCSV